MNIDLDDCVDALIVGIICALACAYTLIVAAFAYGIWKAVLR